MNQNKLRILEIQNTKNQIGQLRLDLEHSIYHQDIYVIKRKLAQHYKELKDLEIYQSHLK